MKKKLIRITTVPISLEKLLGGQLSYMNAYYEVTAVSSSYDDLKRVAMQEGVSYHCVPMTRAITPLQDLVALYKMYVYFRKTRPAIVHTHTPKAGLIGMLAAYLARVPHRLHTVAGLPLLESSGLRRKVLQFVEKITYQCATKVYPNSYGLKAIIIAAQFCSATKLKVLANGSSNGIHTAHFSTAALVPSMVQDLRSSLGLKTSDFVFIFVGRLVADKGIHELVAAFSKLNQEHVKLLLVGSFEPDLDPLREETLAAIATNRSIISVGYQADVRPYFALSQALVFPSYREGFPNVVMQAGSMELPSIVTDINGCNEIIVHGENGVIVPVKDVEALYVAMQQIVQDVPFYLQLQRNARTKIVTNYEQSVVWESLLAEYQKL